MNFIFILIYYFSKLKILLIILLKKFKLKILINNLEYFEYNIVFLIILSELNK